MKATHNGTCQACGRLQASKGSVAKHGYTVKGFGFFHGVCFGSHHVPMEVGQEVTVSTIAKLLEGAAALEATTAEDVKSLSVRTEKRVNFSTVYAVMTEAEYEAFAKASQYGPLYHGTWAEKVRVALMNFKGEARMMVAHAKMLEDLMAARAGQPLVERK